MFDKKTITSIKNLFDQVSSKTLPVRVVVRVGNEEYRIVNTVAAQEITEETEDIR